MVSTRLEDEIKSVGFDLDLDKKSCKFYNCLQLITLKYFASIQVVIELNHGIVLSLFTVD